MGLLDHDLIVVNPGAEHVELTGVDGAPIGVVREASQLLTHRRPVDDAGGRVLEIVRPRLRSRIEVRDGHGQPVGSIVPHGAVGPRRRILLDGAGNEVGSVRDLVITDASGRQVGQITRRPEEPGHALHLDSGAQGPMRLLAIAAALVVTQEQDGSRRGPR